MPDEFAFFAHRCGFATHFAKQTGNDWSFDREAPTRLAAWLLEHNPEGYWDYYVRENRPQGEPFVFLTDHTFQKTWVTESGKIFCETDYVDGKRGGAGIFRIQFLDEYDDD